MNEKKLTPEAQSEIDEFTYHLKHHKRTGPPKIGCRYCALRAARTAEDRSRTTRTT
jgi:hypothetical protein